MPKVKQIIFTKPYMAEYLTLNDLDFSKIKPNQVVVKTVVSSISLGTERANYVGDVNVAAVRNAPTEAIFPRRTGYSSAGEVVAVGDGVKKVKVGDRVAVFCGHHVNYNVVSEDRVVKIDYDNVSYEEAGYGYITTFPLAAVRKVRVELGESLMVMGLGLLGQISVMYAHCAGAYPVIACDPVLERREEALKNGADYVFDPLDANFEKNVRAVCPNGINTAIEVTGVGAGLEETLDCMAKMGRVALLGCTRNSDFTIDYYKKVHGPGITLIGAHTFARPEKESYPGHFTHEDDIKTMIKLCSAGRLPIKNLIKETHNPKDCQAVFTRLANDKNFPLGVQFDWREE
ncbi:MAG: zinc-binding alcohol dehydrogenase [Clostridia bacterium]|nr:zinc-binding alcohol dehydrogenase [Clostridia bacterium]